MINTNLKKGSLHKWLKRVRIRKDRRQSGFVSTVLVWCAVFFLHRISDPEHGGIFGSSSVVLLRGKLLPYTFSHFSLYLFISTNAAHVLISAFCTYTATGKVPLKSFSVMNSGYCMSFVSPPLRNSRPYKRFIRNKSLHPYQYPSIIQNITFILKLKNIYIYTFNLKIEC